MKNVKFGTHCSKKLGMNFKGEVRKTNTLAKKGRD